MYLKASCVTRMLNLAGPFLHKSQNYAFSNFHQRFKQLFRAIIYECSGDESFISINNKLNAKWPPPPPSRSPSLNKINHLINRASTRQKALENVSANKTINVVKHRNYYSQKLREKFGSPSARSPSLNRIDAMINKANTRKKAVEYLAASAIDPVKHRNYYIRKMREKFGPTPRPQSPRNKTPSNK